MLGIFKKISDACLHRNVMLMNGTLPGKVMPQLSAQTRPDLLRHLRVQLDAPHNGGSRYALLL
jgi:hypothetical protein